MVLPLIAAALISGALTGATALAQNAANNRTIKKQNAASARYAQESAAEFDRRMAETRLSDARLAELENKRFAENGALEDSQFGYALNNSRLGFDEQQTIAGKAFDDQMTALGGLMTSRREARLMDAAAVEAEQNRQKAVQDQADQLAGALPDKVGFDAQQQSFAEALASRGALRTANTSAITAPGLAGGSDRLRAEMEGQIGRGRQEAATDAGNADRLAARGDAFRGAERDLGSFASAIGDLTTKANISRQPLAMERGVASLVGAQGQDTYDAEQSLLSDRASRQAGILSDYRGNLADAQSTYGSNWGKALQDFYDTKMGAEADYIGQLTGNSKTWESKLANTTQWRINNMSTFSPFAAALSAAQSGFSAYRSGGASSTPKKA